VTGHVGLDVEQRADEHAELRQRRAADLLAMPEIESLSFGYDQADRIVSRTDGIDPSQSESFDYDDQSRLTGVHGGSDSERYGYDADGTTCG
jgi:hypothetical protein